MKEVVDFSVPKEEKEKTGFDFKVTFLNLANAN